MDTFFPVLESLGRTQQSLTMALPKEDAVDALFLRLICGGYKTLFWAVSAYSGLAVLRGRIAAGTQETRAAGYAAVCVLLTLAAALITGHTVRRQMRAISR